MVESDSYLQLVEDIARIGYESQFDEKWIDLAKKSIEHDMWIRTATRILFYMINVADEVEGKRKEKKIIV